MRKIIIPVIAIAVLAVAVFLGWRAYREQQRTAQLSNLLTEPAAFGDLTAYVGVTGSVRSNQTAIVAWGTSGNVGEVNVQEGDVVSADQVLAALAEDSLAQNVILARADLANAQKSLEDLQASTLLRLQTAQEISATQKSIIEAERTLDRFEEDRYLDSLDRARENKVKAEEDLQKAEEDFERYEDWDEENSTRKSFEDKVDNARLKLDEAVRVYELLVLDKSLAEANLSLAQARLEDAQRRYDRVQDGPDPRDVEALEARITASQATLDLVRLTAPFAGTITDVEIKPGDQASPGKMAFRVDDLTKLLVDVRISEVDINRIFIGQEVNLTFDAIQGKEYTGRVSEVSNIGTITQGVVDFAVTIELLDADERVKPGMTAAVNIVVEKLENVLLVPNRAVRVLNSQRTIYILREDQMVRINITLGATSDTFSEVIGGDLTAGDLIVLNPPLVFETNGPPPFVQR